MDDVKLFDGLAVGRGVGGEVHHRRGQPEPGPRGVVARKHIGAADRAQVPHEARQPGIADLDRVDIGNGQREPRAAEQVPGGADVDLRVDVSGCSAFGLVRSQHRPSQARKAARSGKGGEEQPVRPQGPPDEGERPGQIVDAVKHADADHEIECAVGKGQAVLIAVDASGRPREPPARIGAGDLETARAESPLSAPSPQPRSRARPNERVTKPSRASSSSSARRCR
jgi:hypothetical protein